MAPVLSVLLAFVLASGTGGVAFAQPDASDDAPRIVSLGGSVTEIVYALGGGAQLVGVDASSVYPDAAREVTSVGYFRRVPAEGVLSLSPTLVLASEDTGPPTTLEQLRSAGVDVRVVPETESVEGAKAKIRTVGDALGRDAMADSLIRRMEADLDAARRLRDQAETTPRVLFIYARGAGTMLVAGRETSAEVMVELAGGTNAVTGFSGFKPMTAEAVAAASPDVILVLRRGLESIGGVDGLLEQPGVPLTPAGKDERVVVMDDLLLLSFGPRLGQAVAELTRKLHPAVENATVEDTTSSMSSAHE